MRSILALRRAFAPVFVLLLFLGFAAPRALATHLRGGTLSWRITATTGTPVTSYTVEFTFSESQRWTYPGSPGSCSLGSCPAVGPAGNLDTFTGTGSFNFGDGTTGNPTGNVTSVNQAEDYDTAVFTFTHVYTVASGPHTAYFYATNRVSTLQVGHDQPEYISTLVQYYPNGSPVAAVPAILSVPIQPTVTINLGSAVTDIDPNVTLIFRLSTFAEVYGTPVAALASPVVCPSGIQYAPGGTPSGTPPGFTISSSGIVTWDTTQIPLALSGGNCGLTGPHAGDLWATQIMVEARDANDVLVSETPIDLLLEFVTAVGTLPTITLNPVGPQTVQVNTPVSFTATGSSANPGVKVTLNASGVPVGATTTNLNATVTPPITSNFSWTPTTTQTGTFVVTYTVTDSNLQQATASETIIVANPPTASCSTALTLPYNQSGQVSATVFDPNNEVLNVVWTLDGTTVQTESNVTAFPTATTLNLNQTYGAVGPHTVHVTATDPHGVSASCSTPVTVTIADQTINFGPLSDVTFGAPDFNVSATATSGLTVLFGSSGNCTVNGTTVHITGAGSCTITASQPGNASYNAATPVPQSFNIGKANASITVTGYTVPYDTNSHTASGSATGVGNVSLAGLDLSGTTHTNVNSYTDSWTFTDTTGNYNNSSGSVSDAITPGATTVNVVCTSGPFFYNGSPITPCSATVTGAGLSQSLTVMYSNNTNAGQASASASYSGDANHSGNTGSTNFTISAAPVTATAGSYGPAPFDGNSHPIPACMVTGAYTAGLSCVDDPSSVGPGVSNGSVAPIVSGLTSNFALTPVAGSYSITQAPTTVTVVCPVPPVTYNGSPLTPCSATVTGAGLNQPLTVMYSNNTNVGTASATASYAGDANHTGNSGSNTFKIDPASVTVTAGSYGPAPYDGNTHALSACAVSTNFDNLTCTNNPVGPVGPNVTSGSQSVVPVIKGNTSNYTVNVNNGAYSITPALVTVTAGSYGPLPYDANTHAPSACVVSGPYTAGLSCTNNPTMVGPNVSSGKITPVVGGLNSNFSVTQTNNGMWNITRASLTLAVGGTSQYSDPLATSFTLAGFVGTENATTAGCTGSVSTAATSGSAPGLYGITNGVTCPNYTVGTPVGSYTVTQEDSTLTYTGLQYFGVPASQTTVPITLTFTLQDASVVLTPPASYYDATPGDITTAAAAPISITGSYVASNGSLVTNYTTSCTPTPVVAVPGLTLSGALFTMNSVPSTGTFSCTVTLPVNGTFLASTVASSGSFYRFNGSDTTVTLSTSNGTSGLLTGGGYQLASYLSTNGSGTNGKYVDSSPIMLLPASGTKMNFGFIVKFSKNGNNLQGNVNIIVRSRCLAPKVGGSNYSPIAGSDGLCVYQIKSPTQTSMTDQPGTSKQPGYGNIVGNAIINDVTWSNAQSVFGGGTLTMELYDNQPGGSGTVPDTLSIQVTDNKGNLWFSNNWNGGTLKTVATTGAPQIQGGNVTAH